MKRSYMIVSVGVGVLALIGATTASIQQGRGGPPGIFHADTPKYGLSIIQGNSTTTSVDLSLMSQDAIKVDLELPNGAKDSLLLEPNLPQTVKVSGLEANKTYSYTAHYNEQKLEGRLVTTKVGDKPFRFVVQADSHLDQNTSPESYTKTLRQIVADQPDFLIDLGDTFMTEKHARYQDAVAQYRAQRYYFGIPGSIASVFLVLGNHDGEQGWVDRNKPGMSEWSKAQRKLYFPPAAYSGDTDQAHYYSFQWGEALCIVLDPFDTTKDKPARTQDNWKWTLGERQYKWLAQTLEKSNAKYRFVFIHHLVGGQGKDCRGGAEASQFFEWGGKNVDGSDGFKEHRPDWQMPLHDLFVKYKVDVVFRGHDHLYVKQDRDGIVYQLVPQPSSSRSGSTNSAAEYGYKSGTILPSPGYLRVDIGAESMSVSYIKTSGTTPTVVDSYTIKP